MTGDKKAGHFRTIEYHARSPIVRWFEVRYQPHKEPHFVVYDVVLKEGEFQARPVKSTKRELTDELWRQLEIWY